MRNRKKEKSCFWIRNEVKIGVSGDTCIVVLTQATLTFHPTIEQRNITEKKKKS